MLVISTASASAEDLWLGIQFAETMLMEEIGVETDLVAREDETIFFGNKELLVQLNSENMIILSTGEIFISPDTLQSYIETWNQFHK